MTPIEHIVPEFVEYIPTVLQPGVLYISKKYRTASHMCCCGCGSKVVTPLKPGGWRLTVKRGAATLYPSIGSWNLACQSHYWIREGKIIWARKWSKSEIEAGRLRDQEARETYFDRRSETLWKKVCRWIRRIFGISY